jgi:hypothetical protein
MGSPAPGAQDAPPERGLPCVVSNQKEVLSLAMLALVAQRMTILGRKRSWQAPAGPGQGIMRDDFEAADLLDVQGCTRRT